MKRTTKAILSSALAFSLVLPMTACSKKGKKQVKVKEDDPYFDANVVKLELPLDSDKKVEYSDFYDMQFIGERLIGNYSISYEMPEEVQRQIEDIYYNAEAETEEEWMELYAQVDEIYAEYYQSGLVVFDLDGNYQSTINLGSETNIVSFTEGPNGEMYILCDNYEFVGEEYKEYFVLKQINEKGETLKEIELTGDTENLWGAKIMFLDDGSMLLVSYGAVTLIDANGNQVYSKQNDAIEGGVFFFDDKYYVGLYEHNEDYSEYNTYLQELDVKTGELKGDKTKIDAQTLWGMTQATDGCYAYDGNGLSKINPLKNEKELVLDWDSTDVNYANIQGDSIKVYSEDKVSFISYKWHQEGNEYFSEYFIVTLDRAEKNPHAGKVIISLGTNGIPSDAFLDYIIDYNTNEDNKARMTITDYSADISYEKYEESMAEMADKVYLDMIAGAGPDILVNFSSFSQFNSEDVLLDLNKFIDGKEGLNRDDYFDNVFRAFETKDKLFQIPICVDIHGLLGNKEMIGERSGWTYSEFDQIVSTLPEDVSVFEEVTYDQLLDELLSSSMNTFVDYVKKEVYFDGDDFKQVLELAKKYGVEKRSEDDMHMVDDGMGGMYYEDDYNDPQTLLDEGMLALCSAYVYTLDEFARNSRLCNGNAIYVGYPSPDGSGMAAAPMLTLAIAAKSPNQDEAWDFIRYMFEEDEQYEYSSSFYSIPLSKAAFDRVNEQAIKDSEEQYAEYEKYREQYGDDIYGDWAPIKLTKEDAAGFVKLMESVSTIHSSDPALVNIIQEEAAAFFADQRSVDDVCKNIQDRTTTIVHER